MGQQKEDGVRYLTWDEFEAGLDAVRQSPKDEGTLEMIVRRPEVGEREVLETGELDPLVGLVGDSWKSRRSRRTSNGGPRPDMQINVMMSRVIALVAQDKSRWPLAGDQLFIDLDLTDDNLPPWTRLAIGTAVIQVTDQPHTGCAKFVQRFGVDATKFVNSPIGRRLNLRGINARVVQPGVIRIGDIARKA